MRGSTNVAPVERDRGTWALRGFAPLTRDGKRVKRFLIRLDVEALLGQPGIGAVRVGVALAAVTDQRDDGAVFTGLPHLRGQPQGAPDVGAGRATHTAPGDSAHPSHRGDAG